MAERRARGATTPPVPTAVANGHAAGAPAATNGHASANGRRPTRVRAGTAAGNGGNGRAARAGSNGHVANGRASTVSPQPSPSASRSRRWRPRRTSWTCGTSGSRGRWRSCVGG